MVVDTEKLNTAVQELRNTLKEGLIATDIWELGVGLSIAGYNSQPAAVALFTELTTSLMSTLSDSGFPKLRRYYILELEGDHLVVILRHGNDVLQGGAGDDHLNGGAGSDTYLFGRGDGRDEIHNPDYVADQGLTVNDKLVFAADIAPEQLWFRRVNTHLEVSIVGTDDVVRLDGWYGSTPKRVDAMIARGASPEAVIRLKCRPLGLMRNLDPSAFTANEKWFATASCMFSRAVQRKAAAMSVRSAQCDRLGVRLAVGAFMMHLLQKASGQQQRRRSSRRSG